MENELKRLDKKTLYRQVGEELREYIIKNKLNAGDRLPTEIELAKALGVSRNSVREGIRYLETMGFVETYIKSGMTVKAENLDPLADVLSFNYRRMNISLDEIYEARLLLELIAADLAVQKISKEQLAAMENSIACSEEKNFCTGDINDEDFMFHKTLFAASKNKVIEQFNTVLAEIFSEERSKYKMSVTSGQPPKSNEQTIAEHKRILAALMAGDAEATKKEIRQHLSKYMGTSANS
jgi:GntR family transcriptional repressor for pyruvate dehydrogenase complex